MVQYEYGAKLQSFEVGAQQIADMLIHTQNQMKIGLSKSSSPFQTSREYKSQTVRPTTTKADCIGACPKDPS